jgi:chemotaxis family two-component system sensor kinase Cph1
MANAIKFRSKRNPTVYIAATPATNGWIVSIKDNGLGIPKEQSERIFKMFQRLHTKDEYPGNGIGLAIAKKIVERHNGQIWVESELGKGSTFFFIIPNARLGALCPNRSNPNSIL